MAELRELYQELILDHSSHPRHFRPMEGANLTARGNNPLCGDEVTLFLKLDGGRIADVTFQGSGCAIARASASMLTDAVRGKTEPEARALFEGFHRLVTGGNAEAEAGLGKLAAFAGVAQFPVRVKCASLAWHTLLAAFDGARTPVSTEGAGLELAP